MDRVGFACSFLPDTKLISFIQDLTVEMNKKGDLDGVLLTGMTIHAIPMLQRYLDMTGDVQTISVLAIRTMAQEIPSSVLLKFWIERYRLAHSHIGLVVVFHWHFILVCTSTYCVLCLFYKYLFYSISQRTLKFMEIMGTACRV
jgi:hypothetical protein